MIVLREMAEGDLDAMTAIEAAVSEEPWTRSLFAGELEVHPAERHWLIADGPEGIVGFGGMRYVAEDAHLMNVAVAPTSARLGIGRRLVVALTLEAIDRGAQNLTLEVRVDNEPAKALYFGLKMAPVGLRPGYYRGGKDALVLWAHDIDRPEYRSMLEEAVGKATQ